MIYELVYPCIDIGRYTVNVNIDTMCHSLLGLQSRDFGIVKMFNRGNSKIILIIYQLLYKCEHISLFVF